MLDKLTSKLEGYKEFAGAGIADDVIETALKKSVQEATEKTVKEATETAVETGLKKTAKEAAETAAEKAAREASEKAMKKISYGKAAAMTEDQLKAALKNPKKLPKNASAKEIAQNQSDLIAQAERMKVLVPPPPGVLKKAGIAIKNNPKLFAAGLTATGLAAYMIATGETNPAKAMGEITGDVVSGSVEGLSEGLGDSGIIDSISSSFCTLVPICQYMEYIKLGCLASLVLVVILFFVYIYKTFVK
jgi:hypothetical protein